MGKAASLINMAGLSHEPLVLSIVHLASCEQLGKWTVLIQLLDATRFRTSNVSRHGYHANKSGALSILQRQADWSCKKQTTKMQIMCRKRQSRKEKRRSLTHLNLENSLSPALNQPVKAPCQASIPNKLSLQLGWQTAFRLDCLSLSKISPQLWTSLVRWMRAPLLRFNSRLWWRVCLAWDSSNRQRQWKYCETLVRFFIRSPRLYTSIRS